MLILAQYHHWLTSLMSIDLSRSTTNFPSGWTYRKQTNITQFWLWSCKKKKKTLSWLIKGQYRNINWSKTKILRHKIKVPHWHKIKSIPLIIQQPFIKGKVDGFLVQIRADVLNVDECKSFDNPMQLMKHLSDITKNRIYSLTVGTEGELLN